jgi:hypothetical protein
MLRSWRAIPHDVSPALNALTFSSAAAAFGRPYAEPIGFRQLEAVHREVSMTDILVKGVTPHVHRDMRESVEYRLIFGICFAVFLLAGVVERLMPWSWLAPSRDRGPPLSVVQQALGAAGTCTAYAFKG